MAKRRKKRSVEEELLLPHVSEQEIEPEVQPQSDEARRAQETVDLLIRDLFGEDGVAKPEAEGIAAVALIEREPPEPDDGIVEPEEPTPSEPDSTPSDAMAFFLAMSDEADLEIHTPPAEDVGHEELSFKEHIESSAEDFRLLLEMDYEDELGAAVGFEKIRAYHERGINGRAIDRRRAPRKGEFEMQEQEVDMRRAYGKKKTNWLLRLGVCTLLWIFLMIYERPALMAAWAGGPFDGEVYPFSYIMLGLQLLLASAALCYKPLIEGLLRLVRFCPTNYSFLSVLVLGSFLYHVVLLFLSHASYPTMYLSPAAFCLALLCAVEFFNCCREAMAFDVISTKRQKYALLPRIAVGARGSSARERLQAEDEPVPTLYARPVTFVRNYMANTEKPAEHHRNLGAGLLLILATAVACALYAFATGESAESVWRTFFSTVLLCAPVLSMLLTALPLFFAAALRLRGKGAVVGEATISECEGEMELVLPDREIFAAMEHEHFKLVADCDVHRVTVLVRALLEKLQSPLAEAFGVDNDSRLSPDDFTLLEIEEDGVSAGIKETGTQVCMGTPAYLERFGITLQTRVQENPSLYERMLCVAVDRRLCAMFLVRYTLQDDVVPLLQELARQGVRVCVRSKDPCVRTEIMARLVPRLSRPARVEKPCVQEMELRTERVDAKVVALGCCKEAARTLGACKRVRFISKWGKLLQLLALGAGALIAFAFALLGNAPSAITVTLWLLLWCGAYTTLSYLLLRAPSEE